MSEETQQHLFNYLGSELSHIALQTEMQEIEKIILTPFIKELIKFNHDNTDKETTQLLFALLNYLDEIRW